MPFNLLKWGLVGIIAGGASLFFNTKDEGSGILPTLLLGLGGALLGGYVGERIGFGTFAGMDGPSMLMAVGGAVAIILLKSIAPK